jgi:choloylglycine hydrolase
MMKTRVVVVAVLCGVVVGFAPQVGRSCTTFFLDHGGEMVFGKSYDWMVDDGFLVVNKRGVQKTAMNQENAATWISKFGSVTFNQYGREQPMGGMNEAGLVVEVMWLDGTVYPDADSRVSLNELQWVQYQLDNFDTVEEVVGSDSLIRIVPGGATIHYLVADRNGGCATIEFLEGKMVSHFSEALSSKVLTNSTYEESSTFLGGHKGFGGEEPIPPGIGSLERFVRTSSMLSEYDSKTDGATVDYGFDILSSVSQGEWSVWNMVYDVNDRRIHLRTLVSEKIRYVDLDSLDFSCATPVEILDLNANLQGSVHQHLVPYTREANRDLVGRVFEETPFLRGFPDEVLDAIADYPDRTVCTE